MEKLIRRQGFETVLNLWIFRLGSKHPYP